LLKRCFTSTETVGLLGTGAQDGHLDFYTPPDLCRMGVYVILYILMYLTDMTSTKNSAIQFSVALHPE